VFPAALNSEGEITRFMSAFFSARLPFIIINYDIYVIDGDLQKNIAHAAMA